MKPGDENLFDPDGPVPRAVAIIMDGNGRWARARGKPRREGHRAGAESIRRAVEACGDWGIECLILYAFSTENWSRPPDEVAALMDLLERYLKKQTKTLMKHNIRLQAIGDVSRLPAHAHKALDDSIETLSRNTGPTLALALNYGARDEIVRAARELARAVAAGEIDPEALDETAFGARLDTAGLPDPDLLIRTAGEMRISNFLLWQISYAEFYVTDVCWPDFDRATFGAAIATYQARTRKYGQVVE